MFFRPALILSVAVLAISAEVSIVQSQGGGPPAQPRPRWIPQGGVTHYQNVGHEYRQDDMPSIASSPDGSLWVAWISFDGSRDDIAIRHRRVHGSWQNLQWVPGSDGDNWAPQVSVDGANRVWVVWSLQVEGNWDIYARRFDPEESRWSQLEQLSSDPLPDIHPRVSSDGQGGAALAWQGFRTTGAGTGSDIFLRVLKGDQWTDAVQVTRDAANEWEPAVAVDSEGVAWIAYDSYRQGNCDVFLARVARGEVTESAIPVAVTPRFEARAAVAVDTAGRVWVTWERGPSNWGKDLARILPDFSLDNTLGSPRTAEIAYYQGGRWREPKKPLSRAYDDSDTYHPRVFSDGSGSVWVLSLSRQRGPSVRPNPDSRLAYFELYIGRPLGFWEYQATHLDGEGWSNPVSIPHSKGRLSTRISGAPAAGGQLWLAWPTDNRSETYYHRPIRQEVYAGVLDNVVEPQALFTSPRADQPLPEPSPGEANLQVIRDHRIILGGEEHRLLRGDLHRHTELSWDEGGQKDGSLQDFCRYMLDAAQLDFGANAEHQGGLWPYWLWDSQKMTDMYHIPGRYSGLFGFERSASFPFGHRNVFFAKRHQSRLIPFFVKEGVSLYALPLTSEGDEPADESMHLVENETELVYEEIRSRQGIAIPHTTGTGMGTDWHVHDSQVEPVAEIFQGMRQSYEQVDALYASTTEQIERAAERAKQDPASWPMTLGRIRPEGMLSEAWKKGHRLGVIASSDHISTHMSYAMVYTPDSTREAILESIRARHTYAATDNIILEVWMGKHFMGEEFTASEALPALSVKARGTGSISRVDVLRDSQVGYSSQPAGPTVDLEYQDQEATRGTHYYYVRILQEDGMIA